MNTGEEQYQTVLDLLGRIPCKPLPYMQKEKATPNEIMMDYEQDIGHLYLMGPDGKTVIDLDRNIKDINETTAEDVKVTIDGETTSLYELLYVMKTQIGNTVKAKLIADDVVYTQKRYAYDQSSIETNLDSVQIAGFSSAPELSIPMKMKDGTLTWVAISEFTGNNSASIPGSSNADDGIVSTVVDLLPLNDKIYLLASKKQTSKYLTKNYKVFLPKTMDSYSEINWAVITNSYAPKLEFQSNVTWMYKDNIQPSVNNTNVYVFKTWDNGETWYAELSKYNKIAVNVGFDVDTAVKVFPTREEIQNNYYDKEEADEKFVTNQKIERDYYNKQETIDLVSWKTSPYIINNNEGGK